MKPSMSLQPLYHHVNPSDMDRMARTTTNETYPIKETEPRKPVSLLPGLSSAPSLVQIQPIPILKKEEIRSHSVDLQPGGASEGLRA